MKPITKRFFPKLLFVLVTLAITGMSRNSSGLKAQIQLGFSSIGLIGVQDTVISGDTVIIGSYLLNHDTGYVFSDSVQINGYIDTGFVNIHFSFPAVPQVVIQPLDSVFFLLPFWFRDNHMGGDFRIGNNVIVVWPVFYDPNVNTIDTITFNVFVIDTISGIGPDLSEGGAIRCYPVPASGPLYVTSGNNSLVIKEITIHNAEGKLIAVSNNPASGINTDSWAAGVYLLEIEFENGQRSTYKIIR